MMVREDGVVKVLDFGIARRQSSGIDPHGHRDAFALPTLPGSRRRLGTPFYMALEQIAATRSTVARTSSRGGSSLTSCSQGGFPGAERTRWR